MTIRLTHIPNPYRDMLKRLSKDDLMELAWKLGFFFSSDADASTFENLKRELNQILQNAGRRPWSPKLPKARTAGRQRQSIRSRTGAASRLACHCGGGGCICCGGSGPCLGPLPPERLSPEKP
jgi:hypothetical protein